MDEVLAWFASLLAALFSSLGADDPWQFSGYAEAEYVYVAPPVTRRIIAMAVEKGGTVAVGDLLFELEGTREDALLKAAVARREVAAANLENLETGSREQELRVLRASLEQALAEQALAQSNLRRSASLLETRIVAQSKVDADRAALERANALVEQLRAQLEVAELPARSAQIVAARSSLEAANAEVEVARAAHADVTVTAPVGGRIENLYYLQGEVAAAGAPVLSILPPDAVKIVFYVPETERQAMAVGLQLDLSCDGCPTGLQARITRMASDPQFTPPILYSRDERARLVFRAEAELTTPYALLPGQPVSLGRRQ